MGWRIHFTAEDLARIRVAPTLGPLAETMFGLSLLRCTQPRPAALTRWRHQTRPRITAEMMPLISLIPRGSQGVDLWTLTGEAPTIERGIHALLAVSRERLLPEIEAVDRCHRLPASVWRAADQGSDGRQRLATAAYASYHTLVAPHWPRLRAHLQAEHVSRGRILQEGGIERLLATLNPTTVRWRLPVLEIMHKNDTDFHLMGRGLTLVPSMFVGDLPVLLEDLHDATASPRLVFPAARDPVAYAQFWSQPDGHALAALVGRTRAAALRQIADGCTTSELARHIGVTPAAASQHASVLRDAGLITTRRQGSAVLHALTPLGADLLQAG
jgi:DNA-binding transcriptional ArsR family regulator